MASTEALNRTPTPAPAPLASTADPESPLTYIIIERLIGEGTIEDNPDMRARMAASIRRTRSSIPDSDTPRDKINSPTVSRCISEARAEARVVAGTTLQPTGAFTTTPRPSVTWQKPVDPRTAQVTVEKPPKKRKGRQLSSESSSESDVEQEHQRTRLPRKPTGSKSSKGTSNSTVHTTPTTTRVAPDRVQLKDMDIRARAERREEARDHSRMVAGGDAKGNDESSIDVYSDASEDSTPSTVPLRTHIPYGSRGADKPHRTTDEELDEMLSRTHVINAPSEVTRIAASRARRRVGGRDKILTGNKLVVQSQMLRAYQNPFDTQFDDYATHADLFMGQLYVYARAENVILMVTTWLQYYWNTFDVNIAFDIPPMEMVPEYYRHIPLEYLRAIYQAGHPQYTAELVDQIPFHELEHYYRLCPVHGYVSNEEHPHIKVIQRLPIVQGSPLFPTDDHLLLPFAPGRLHRGGWELKFNNLDVKDELLTNRRRLSKFPRIFDRAVRSTSSTSHIHKPQQDLNGRQLASYHLPRARGQNNVTMPSVRGLTNNQTRLVGFYNGSYVRVPAREMHAGIYNTGAWSENQDRLYGKADNSQEAGNTIGIPHTRISGLVVESVPSPVTEHIDELDIMREEVAQRLSSWNSLARNDRDNPQWYDKVNSRAKELIGTSNSKCY